MESVFHPEVLEHAATAAFGALILGGFYHLYRKTYLLHWTFSWIALVVSHLSVFTTSVVETLHWPLAALTAAAGFLHAVYLGFGMYEISYHRPVRFRSVRMFVIGGALSGALLGLLSGEQVGSISHSAAAPVAICAS